MVSLVAPLNLTELKQGIIWLKQWEIEVSSSESELENNENMLFLLGCLKSCLSSNNYDYDCAGLVAMKNCLGQFDSAPYGKIEFIPERLPIKTQN